MSDPTTVREVLDLHVGTLTTLAGKGDDVTHNIVTAILADLRDVLSTGEAWVPREIDARLLRAGDVMVTKSGELWAVTALAETDRGEVSPEIVRGDQERHPAFDPYRGVKVLLTRTDDRALDLLARELGAETVERVSG